MTPASAEPLDLVVRGGRVLDPSTGLDARLDVGVCYGRIVALEDAIGAVTSKPAAAIGRSATLGSLAPGRIADIAVFDVASGERRNRDSYGGSRTGSVAIGVRQTIRAGIPRFAPLPHPGRGVAVRTD